MEITFGKDDLGPAVVIEADTTARVTTPGTNWRKNPGRKEGTTVWRLPEGTDLSRPQTPCPPAFLDVINKTLDKIPTKIIHPAFTTIAESEAKRLYPNIASESAKQFAKFQSFLGSEFGFQLKEQKEMHPFVDDLGPSLLAIVDGAPVMLPEIPPVFLAPADWRISMWWVTNHMIGPLLFPDIADADKVQFRDLNILLSDCPPAMEALVYYHAARAIIIFDAWQGDPEAPHLMYFTKLIAALGIRPLHVTKVTNGTK